MTDHIKTLESLRYQYAAAGLQDKVDALDAALAWQLPSRYREKDLLPLPPPDAGENYTPAAVREYAMMHMRPLAYLPNRLRKAASQTSDRRFAEGLLYAARRIRGLTGDSKLVKRVQEVAATARKVARNVDPTTARFLDALAADLEDVT